MLMVLKELGLSVISVLSKLPARSNEYKRIKRQANKVKTKSGHCSHGMFDISGEPFRVWLFLVLKAPDVFANICVCIMLQVLYCRCLPSYLHMSTEGQKMKNETKV